MLTVKRREIDQLGDPGVTVLQLDYSFASDEPGEGAAKMLGIVNTKTGYIATTMVTQKGSQFAFGVTWVGKLIERSSARRVCLQTDPEPSIVDVATKAAANSANGYLAPDPG